MSEKAKTAFKEYLKLFLVFLKLGVFTFGGGYAMISLLENECIEKRKWLTSEEFFKIITIAEITPGPIAINSATYIGYTRGKILGSFLATLGAVLPSFIIIFVISLFFDRLLEITVIANAFKGIKAGVAVLIFFAGIKMMSKLNKNVFAYVLMIAAVAANLTITILAYNFSTIYLILIGGAIGFIAFLIANRDKLNLTKKDTKNTETDDKTVENAKISDTNVNEEDGTTDGNLNTADSREAFEADNCGDNGNVSENGGEGGK